MCDDEYESGPWCEHWSHPSDCDAMCKCGHKCHQHDIYSDEERWCNVDDCDCKAFEDVVEETNNEETT